MTGLLLVHTKARITDKFIPTQHNTKALQKEHRNATQHAWVWKARAWGPNSLSFRFIFSFHFYIYQCCYQDWSSSIASLINALFFIFWEPLEAIKVDLSRVMIKPNISNGASAVDSIAHIYHVWKDELHTPVVVKSSKTAHTKSNKISESRRTILWISSTESPTNFKADVNHVKRWDCSSQNFSPSLPKRSMQRSFSDKTKDGSRPAHTEQILPLDQRKQLHHCCRRSIVLAAVVTKRGFRIAFHAPPVLLRGFALPELEGGEKRLAAHAG